MKLRKKLKHARVFAVGWIGPFLKDVAKLERSAWVIIVIAAIVGFASFSVELDLMPFFKHRLGLSNKSSGELFGIRGVTSMLVAVPCSLLVDKLGLKVSMVLGSVISAVLSVMLALSDDKFSIETVINLGLPAAAVMIGIPMRISAGRIHNVVTRLLCFSLIYWSDNVGDVIAAFTNPYMVSYAGLGQFEMLFLITALANLLVGAVVLLTYTEPPVVVEYVVAGDVNNKIAAYELSKFSSSSDSVPPEETAAVESTGVQPESISAVRSLFNVLLSRSLWRCIAVSFVFMWSRTLFRHMTSTIPIYMQNLYGLDVNYSFAIGINPMILTATLPFFMAITRKPKNISSRLFAGTLIVALSPLPVIFIRGGSLEIPVWMMITALTIGEMIYSPLLEMVAVSLAPEEHKALYMILAGLPSVLGTLFSGFEAGYLLEVYSPEPVTLHYDHWATYSSENMWIWIALGGLASPILWILFQPFIESKEPGLICSGRREIVSE